MEKIGLFGRGREPKDSYIIILRLEIRMFRSHEVGAKGGELGCLKYEVRCFGCRGEVGVRRGQIKVLNCLEHVSTLGRRCSDRRGHIPLELNFPHDQSANLYEKPITTHTVREYARDGKGREVWERERDCQKDSPACKQKKTLA